MKSKITLVLLGLFVATAFVGCSSVGPRKYVLFGDPKAEKVEIFEDYWEDYPFKPDDPDLPLRRGKGGVVRFFKKNNYTRSILVDGDLTVNVYYSVDDGVTLTQPDAQLVLTSEELNKKHRKFDKETGYSYHVYLDLGEYDQPEEEITILSIFKDAKTGQATLSKEIRTTVMGTTPLNAKGKDSEMESEAVRWAKKKLGKDVEDPIAALQEKYSARKKAKLDEEERTKSTRVRETIDLDDSQFEDIPEERSAEAASYLEEAQARREAVAERIKEDNQEKSEYYRDLKRKRTEEYLDEQGEEDDSDSPLRKNGEVSNVLYFSDASKTRDSFQKQEELFQKTARQIAQREKELEEEKEEEEADSQSSLRSYSSKIAEDENGERSQTRATGGNAGIPKGFAPPKRQSIVDMDDLKPSEMDLLDDFQPDPDAPNTEIYIKEY